MAFYGGVIKLFPQDKLFEEMAFIAYYMHWTRDEIMNLEHGERIRWCKEISVINSKLNGDEKRKNIFDV